MHNYSTNDEVKNNLKESRAILKNLRKKEKVSSKVASLDDDGNEEKIEENFQEQTFEQEREEILSQAYEYANLGESKHISYAQQIKVMLFLKRNIAKKAACSFKATFSLQDGSHKKEHWKLETANGVLSAGKTFSKPHGAHEKKTFFSVFNKNMDVFLEKLFDIKH